MQFKQDNMWPVSGFKEPQDLGVDFYASGCKYQQVEGPDVHYFGISTEGDIVVDDGHIHWGVHEVQLDVKKAKELYDEIEQWLISQGISLSPRLGLKKWDLNELDAAALAENFQKIDMHDGTSGREVNRQDDSSSS